MVKASALYMVIVIALVIGVICSSLVVSAYYYRLEGQKAVRYTLLQNNLNSTINIIVGGSDTSHSEKTISLFNGDNDSVNIKKMCWGVFDIGVARSFIQKDTLYKAFAMAYTVDSTKWACLYLADNQRPLALSGKTSIIGNVFVSPAGVTQSYVNNSAYSGDKRLVIGTIGRSNATLPPLDSIRLQQLKEFMSTNTGNDSLRLNTDSIQNSFLSPTKFIKLGIKETTLANLKLSGNIVLFSDTDITMDSTVLLNNVMIFAKSITVKSGSQGNCQLFATDSILIGQRCRFDYPSCAGILRFKSGSIIKTQAKINIQNQTVFSGLIFTYEKKTSAIAPLINIGSKTKVQGQIYSQGFLQFNDGAEVDGSVMTNGLLYQTSFTRYENYLVNVVFNEKALSPYYLTSGLIPVATQRRKVLQWLEAN
jgi:hypothetical protein